MGRGERLCAGGVVKYFLFINEVLCHIKYSGSVKCMYAIPALFFILGGCSSPILFKSKN